MCSSSTRLETLVHDLKVRVDAGTDDEVRLSGYELVPVEGASAAHEDN